MSAGDAVLNWTGDATLSTGYNIYESTDGGNTFTYLDSTVAGTTTYTATTDQLTAGTAYVFQVTAVDASGETSASSNADFTAPTAPTNVAVTLSPDATSATVTWAPGDSLAEGYIITRTPDDGSSGTVTVATPSGNATSLFADTGLDPTQAYTYTVTPYYTAVAPASGDPTGTGMSASADTYTGNIENFAVTSASGSGAADLTWQYQGSDSFEIEEQDTGAAGTNYATIATPGGRSWDVLGLTPGDTYNFRIRADHSDGTASDYSTQSITLPGPTATITASNDADSATPNIALNYSADLSHSGDPVSYYNIQWYNNAAPGTGWVGLGLFPGSTSSQEVGVQAMETGSFRVQASYADGTLSAWSPTATATSGYGNDPPADPSTVTPATVTATAASDTSVTLTYASTLPAYAIGTANGTYSVAYSPDSAVCGTESTPQTVQTFSDSSGGGSTTITGLTPGVKYDFVVSVSWTTEGGNGSDESSGGGFGEATATTTGNTAPTAPAAISAAMDPTVANQVDIYWQNTSNDETGFQLQRSSDGGQTWANVGSELVADQTTATDSLSGALADLAPGALEYDVIALDGAVASPASLPATGPTSVAADWSTSLIKTGYVPKSDGSVEPLSKTVTVTVKNLAAAADLDNVTPALDGKDAADAKITGVVRDATKHTITFEVQGLKATPKDMNAADLQVVLNDSDPKVKIANNTDNVRVVIPVTQTHTVPQNMYVANKLYNPTVAAFELPGDAGQTVMPVTFYGRLVTVKFYDQYGDILDGIYNGQPVWENFTPPGPNDTMAPLGAGPISLGSSLKNGTIVDAVGIFAPSPGGQVDDGGNTAKTWAAAPQVPVPAAEQKDQTSTQTQSVIICSTDGKGGFSVSPDFSRSRHSYADQNGAYHFDDVDTAAK